MKLRTQLIITMVVFGLALCIIVASVITTDQQVNQLNNQEALAKNIGLQVSELNYLSNDYLLYNESQQVGRWDSMYSSVSIEVSNLSVDSPDKQVLVNDIKEDQQNLNEVFNDIVTHAATQSQNNTVNMAFVQVSSSRIGVQTQGIVFDASALSQKLADEADQQKQINELLIASLLGIFIIFLITNYFLIYRNTIKRISTLQAGTRIIGAGNLDYSIEEKKGDEFYDLSHAFNQMTAQLKTVTASKADLEREVAERKQAEKALQEKQEELEVQAEELEAQTEELSANNEELVRQIEERKLAEEALRVSEEKYRELVENANSIILRYDMDGCITFFNEYAQKFFGYTLKEIIGKDVNILLPAVESTGRDLTSLVKDILSYPEQYVNNINENVCKNGERVWVSWTNKAVRDSKGNLVEILVVGNNITERKHAEEEIKEAKMQAELYLDLMGHDISNMHQIAMGQLELANEIMDEEGGLKGDEKELIETPLATLNRSAQLIANVRKLQSARRGEIKEESIDINDLLSNIVKEYEFMLPANSIKFADDIPRYILANKLIHDVFTNLVSNGIKHSNGNGVDINIKLENVSDNGRNYYKVFVEDTGPGIPDDMKDKVFNRLQRGDTKARGVGLGLYLVKTLVESYHGKVWVEDRVKGDHTQGSRFVVLLPAVEYSNGN
jgi:PAS domain S-box-containing protein